MLLAMSTNLKNLKLAHLGCVGGSAGYGISQGKLLAHHNINGSSSNVGGATNAGSGSKTTAGGAAAAAAGGTALGGAGAAPAGGGGFTDADVFTLPSGTQIPLIRSRELVKQLPTLAAALQRPADEHLAAEELDAVQLELELMLSNVALRARVLKNEYECLDRDEKRRKQLETAPSSSCSMLNGMLGLGSAAQAAAAAAASTISVASSGHTTNGHSSNSGLGSPINAASSAKRKLRDEPTGVRKKHSSMTILKQQQQLQGAVAKQLAKHSPMTVHTDDSMDYVPQQQQQQQQQQPQQQLPKVALPKNDMPNKFWLSVEPYCMPLTHEDLRLIDDLLEQYRGPLVPPIPALGPHYASVWAQEDIKLLQPGGARHKTSQNANVMLKKAAGKLEESITGPLTQRLVSALMDESLPSEQAAVGEQSSNSSSNEQNGGVAGAAAGGASSSANFRSLSLLKHGVGIEQRLKKELIDSGLIDAKELAAQSNVDEVLLEIKRVTAEISSVAQFNSDELKRLRCSASEEIKRIELKRKLDTIDQEILECYRRMLQYRQKRKGHSNEEKQEILRLTSEQRALAEKLERMELLHNANGDAKL